MRKYYLPSTDDGRSKWIMIFNGKLPAYATLFGITEDEVKQVDDDAVIYVFIVNRMSGLHGNFLELSEYKRSLTFAPLGTPIGAFPVPQAFTAPAVVPAGIFTRIGKLVMRIKGNEAYTEAIGADLGIIGEESIPDYQSLKPALKIVLVTGQPKISYRKKHTDSLKLFVDRKDGKGFVFLVSATKPNFTDKTKLPDGVNSAIWDYKGVYVVNDEEVGEYSDTVSITVSRII